MSILRLINNKTSAISVLTLVVVLVSTTCAFAIVCPGPGGDFTVSSGTTVGQQTLDGGDTGTIEQGGAIETTGDNSYGVITNCDNNTVNNSGSISTMGDDAYGIWLEGGTGNIATNSGSISTMGSDAYGIFVDGGTGNTANNFGSISTMGNNANGILLNGGIGNTANNSGSISTMGNNAYGIWLNGGTGNTANNFGSISTMGSDAYGIRMGPGTGNIATNSGSISTMGSDAYGILLQGGTGNIATNSGSISTMGNSANGIWWTGGTGNTVNNFGSISTMGNNANGILLSGGLVDSTINNYGGIIATGSGSLAILDTNGINNTLNIYPGSQIVGGIVFQQTGDVINIFGTGYGAGSSSTLMFAGTPTVNLMGNNMVCGGGVCTVIDPTGPSVNGAALGMMMSGVHNVLVGRGGPPNPPQVASTQIQPGMMPSADDSQIWFSGFGSHRERDTDGSVLAYDHDYYGGVGGYEMELGRSSRIGFLAGYAFTDLATDFQSLYTNTHSGFIGTYGQVRFGSFNLDGSLIGGYEQNDNNRIVVDNINGFELAEADYDSFFISPSITLSSQYKVHQNIVLRPSATATYSIAWYDDYTETGTTQSNLTIDDRTAQAVVTKLQMVAAYVFGNGSEVGLLAGGRFRYTINDDVNATLAGTSFRYASSGDDTHFEALVGAHARVSVTNNLNLTINGQYALSDGIETTIYGQAGVEFIF
jgi:hypothetical protein